MTVTGKSIGKWLAIVGAIASTVIGAVGPGQLPNGVRIALVIVGAVVAAIERVLATTITITSKATVVTSTELPKAS